ncbi:isoamyl acetate-hydrolyzing esterase 1 homolog isoform X1 [Amblyomma americanum]
MSTERSSPRVFWPRIYLLGDTLTQFSFRMCAWGQIIAESYSSTRAWRHTLPLVLGPEDAAYTASVVVMLGTSDSAEPRDPEGSHVPLEEYAENLQRMLDYLMACGIPEDKVILVTPPPIDEQLWLANAKRQGKDTHRTLVSVTMYAKECASVGSRRGVKVVDAHSEFLKDAHWSRLLSDGINLSPAGSHKLTTLLLPAIKEVVGEAPRLFPDFANLDPEKPGDGISVWTSEACGCARL